MCRLLTQQLTEPLASAREAVARLEGGKTAGICNISRKLLTAGGEAMIRVLYVVLMVAEQLCIIFDREMDLVFPIWM